MRYRAMDANGDYLFGNTTPFLIDTPAAVAQAISTRLKLYTGEWFLDNREGLDKSQILGYDTQGTRDLVIKRRIAGTRGFEQMTSYESDVNVRDFDVTVNVDTIYGPATLTTGF